MCSLLVLLKQILVVPTSETLLAQGDRPPMKLSGEKYEEHSIDLIKKIVVVIEKCS